MKRMDSSVRGLWLVLSSCVLTVIMILAASTIQASTAQARKGNKIVMISIDGLRPDFYLSPEWKAPNLKALAKKGAKSKGINPVFPSLTYPNHTSLLTGVRTNRHGVISNSIFDWERGPLPKWYFEYDSIEAPTLFKHLRRQGMRTAAIRWPVTVDAKDVDSLVPEVFAVKGHMAGDVLLEGTDWEITEKLTHKSLLNELADAGLTPFTTGKEADRWGTDATIHLMKKHQPDFLAFHIQEVDHAEHGAGPDSDEAKEAVEWVDGLVGEIAKAADSKTCILIVGDHGFQEVEKSIYINNLFVEKGWIELDANGKLLSYRVIAHQSGAQAAIYVRQEDRALLSEVREVLTDNQDLGYHVLSRRELNRLGSYPDAVMGIEAKPGFTIGSSYKTESVVMPASIKGQHGYRPGPAKMRTGFIASGCNIKGNQTLNVSDIVDIAPTAASLMGFEMPNVDGQPLKVRLR